MVNYSVDLYNRLQQGHKEKKMKKNILILLTTAVLIFSSIITGCAASFTQADTQADEVSLKLVFRCFTESSAAIAGAVVFCVAVALLIIFGKKLRTRLDNSTASAMTNTFIVFFSVFGIASLAMAFATDGETWSNLMHHNPMSDAIFTQFEDYIINLKNAGTQQFFKSADTNTPFSHLIFFILAQFVPAKYLFSESLVDYILILRNQTFMYLYLLLVVFVVVLIYRMNRYVLRRNTLNIRDEIVAFLLVVSYPAVFCIEKGNFTGISLVLSMVFVLFCKEDKHLIRELSFVALAISAAITPYTLILAILLLDGKGKKAVLNFARTVIYFLILFITPAVFTGFGNILTYAKAFVSVSSEGFVVGNMSIVNLLHFFGISNSVIIYAVFLLTQIIALLAMIMLPSLWQKTAAAAYIMINIFSVSDATAAMFLFIPLVFLLAEKKHKAADWVYMLTIALVVTPFPEWFRGNSNRFSMFLASMDISNIHNANNLISLAAVQFLLVILFYQMTALMKKKKTEKNNSQQIQAAS